MNGAIVNNGTFAINGGAAGYSMVNLGSNVTLSGGGTVNLNPGSGSTEYLRGNGVTLTNTNNTIQGAGNIGDSGALAIVNQATINANLSGQALNVNQANGGVTNTATLEATGGGVLQLYYGIANTAAAITASGTGSFVNVVNATITGGTLTATGGGVIQTLGSSDLKGVTIASGTTYTSGSGQTTQIDGAIVNQGSFAISGGNAGYSVFNLGSNVTLSGGGTINLNPGTGSTTYLRGNGVTLTNTNNTIQGAGNIGDSGALAIINQATIDANLSGQALSVNQANGGVSNAGTLDATGGGVLQLYYTITNTGAGAIIASGTGSVVNVDNAAIVGGTLTGTGGGVFQTVGSADLKGVTISSGTTYASGSGQTTQLDGAIVNGGTIAISGGAAGYSVFNIGSNVTLSGGGTINLNPGSGSTVYPRGNGVTLTNANNTIQGAGNIGDSGVLAIVNQGAINANVSGLALGVNQAGGALSNTGALEATNGGNLDIFVGITGGGQIKIGAGSEVELHGATSENSTFLGASSAKLRIDNATSTAYTGTIGSFVSGDILELGNTSATKATAAFNSGTNTSTLTVDYGSGGVLTFTLAGNLSGDTFGVTQIGADSDIAISSAPVAFAQAHSLLTGPVPSGFIESNGLFGGSGNAQSGGQFDLVAALHPHA